MDLSKKTDQELIDLTTELETEKNKRKLSKMPDDKLFKIAKAKNGEFTDEEALSALHIMLNRKKPNLGLISTLKKMSHSETIRDECDNFLFG